MSRVRDPFAVAVVVASAGALVLTGLAASGPGVLRPWSVAGAPGPGVPDAGTVTVPDAAVTPPPVPAGDGVTLTSATREVRAEVDPGWVASVAAATAIPPVALRAYARATLRVAAEDPACRLGWTTLAAVGAVESGHGTHGGATLGEDGRSTPRILGPALDGDGVAAIRATPESTAMHGDPAWDHAVGPMQMLPSTWVRWGVDADLDGAADANDLDDAALAAAHYLCAAGGDLATGDGWRAAVLAYNHSDEYVGVVLTTADAYAATP